MSASVGDAEPEPGFAGLAEVIEQIRGELELAHSRRADSPIGFAVGTVSLEFIVQVHKSGTGKGGLRIGVVTAELGGAVDRGTTHRVQVDLQPEWENRRLRLRRGGGRRGEVGDAPREERRETWRWDTWS